MQLYCKPADDGLIVLAVHADGDAVPLSAYPGATVVLPYAGTATMADLLGRPVLDINLGDYAAARRYLIEISGVSAKVAGETVTVSTHREDRDGLRDTMTAILGGMRKDGATFKFVEGPRSATNAEMQAAIGAAFGHVQAAYDAERAVDIGLSATPPTITTMAQVDAALAKVAA